MSRGAVKTENMQALRAWAEVDASALRHNLAVVQRRTPDAGVIAITKADAYGHGVDIVIPELDAGVAMFGVASLDEARQLPAKRPVLLLGPCLPAERPDVIREGFIPSVSSYDEAKAYSELLEAGETMKMHFAVDTGMGRMGVWQDEFLEQFTKTLALENVHVEAIFTHLPCADEDAEFTDRQLSIYSELVSKVEARHGKYDCHVLNSAGIVNFPAWSGRFVRAGLMLYGVSPEEEFQKELRPVMKVCARVTLVRELGAGRSVSYGRTYITSRKCMAATLPIGYADGFPRTLSGRNAEVLIHGQRCPVLGRVTMDQIVVDISLVGDVAPGDEAVILGRQGEQEITARELANKAGTISWEILTGIQQRVVRIRTETEG